nr:methyl-accepting chemotaxis protein [Brucepastera parasyntrophica]
MLLIIIIFIFGIILGMTGNLRDIFWVFPLAIIACLGFLYVIIKRISDPVKKASAVANDLANGDGDLTIKLAGNNKNEIGDLGTRLNTFTDSLSRIVTEIRNGVYESKSNSEEAQGAVNTALESVSEISELIESIKESIIGQSGSFISVSSTIEEMVLITKEQDEKIGVQSVNVSESSSAIEEMMANINSIAGNLQKSENEFNRLNTEVEHGRVKVQSLKDAVVMLNNQSDSVFEANKIIRNIANQTNLLAMNAAIEAAHAGRREQASRLLPMK